MTSPLLTGIDTVSGYEFYTARDLYTIPPPPMLIEDVLPKGGIMGITSFPGVGKSWLALEVIRSVALGQKFLGHFPSIEGSCLFVGSDSSVYDYARQWTRLARSAEEEYAATTAGWNAAEEAERMSKLLGPDWAMGPFEPARFLLQSPFMFESPDEIRRLIATCRTFRWGPEHPQYDDMDEFIGSERRHGFDVIIFDTLSRLTRANQNDNTEMEDVFRNIRSIAELTGAACIVLHHNAKRTEFNDGTDWRGAMSQIGALDSWIQLSPAKKDKYLIGVEYKKFRGITPDNFAYRMEVTDPDRASLSAANVATVVNTLHDDTYDAVIQFLVGNAGTKFSVAQVTDALAPSRLDLFGGSRKKLSICVRTRLETAIEGKNLTHPTVHKEGGGSRANRAYYWVEAPRNETPDAD